MAKYQFVKGETSVILPVFIQDSSSSTGAGLGSLVQGSSIVGGYMKRNGTGVALAVDEDVTTEGTYQAPTSAAQVRIGTPANMRAGCYELHFHNDLFTSADYVMISLGGATNMADIMMEIQLTDFDMNTDIGLRIPAALVSGRMDSNMSAINDAAASAVRLALSAGQMIPGTVDNTAFTATTTILESDDITEDTADNFNGRNILWTSGIMIASMTAITDYALTGGRGRFTVSTMPETPGDNDTFIVI